MVRHDNKEYELRVLDLAVRSFDNRRNLLVVVVLN